jgi:hypothetical protein
VIVVRCPLTAEAVCAGAGFWQHPGRPVLALLRGHDLPHRGTRRHGAQAAGGCGVSSNTLANCEDAASMLLYACVGLVWSRVAASLAGGARACQSARWCTVTSRGSRRSEACCAVPSRSLPWQRRRDAILKRWISVLPAPGVIRQRPHRGVLRRLQLPQRGADGGGGRGARAGGRHGLLPL